MDTFNESSAKTVSRNHLLRQDGQFMLMRIRWLSLACLTDGLHGKNELRLMSLAKAATQGEPATKV